MYRPILAHGPTEIFNIKIISPVVLQNLNFCIISVTECHCSFYSRSKGNTSFFRLTIYIQLHGKILNFYLLNNTYFKVLLSYRV